MAKPTQLTEKEIGKRGRRDKVFANSMKIMFPFLLALFIQISLKAQELPAPFNTITSDFGPRRFNDTARTYNFHEGIDYRMGVGSAILSVEGGTVGEIAYGGGWYFGIIGSHGLWA